MNHNKKRLRFTGNLSYILSAAFVIAAVVMNVMPPQPVLAGPVGASSNSSLNVPANSGAIWTTLNTCGNPTQDINQYSIGDHVYINGDGFSPNTSYAWAITGQPGGASGDPNIDVASGSFTTDANGAFCFDAYTIAGDDWGEYSVKFSNKGDNYRVNAATVVLGCTDPTATNYNPLATQDDGSCTYPPVDVCPNIDGNQATVPQGMYVNTDGNCVPIPPGDIPGCTDPTALNYNSDATVDDQSCIYPPQPTADVFCYTLESSSFKVNVGNTGASGEIGYSTDLNTTITSLGVIANGGSVQVLIPGGASTLYLYPMGLSDWGSATSISLSKAEVRICEEDPISLTTFCSYVNSDQPFGWTVTNNSPFSITFTWTYGPESGGPTTLASGTSANFATGDHTGSVMNIYVDGFLLASTEVHEICPAFQTLSLTAFCAANPNVNNGWTAHNPNAFSVDAEWRVNGSALTGLLTIPAGSSANFYTPVSEGNIGEIYVGGILQDSASAAVECTPGNNPEPTPEIPTITVPTGGTQVLIPVTGVADNFPGLAHVGFLSLGASFFGLGLVLHGLARRKEYES